MELKTPASFGGHPLQPNNTTQGKTMTKEQLYMKGYEEARWPATSDNKEYLRGRKDYHNEDHFEYIELSREIHISMGKYEN